MRQTATRALVLVVVLGMATSAMSGGAAAGTTPSIDTSTTDATSTTSEVRDGDVYQNYNGSDNGTQIVQSIVSNYTVPELGVYVNSSGRRTLTNSSMANITAGSEGSHWNGSFGLSSLADVEHGINDNVTVDVVVLNNSTTSVTEPPQAAEMQVVLNTTDARTVQAIDSADVKQGDIVSTLDQSGTFGINALANDLSTVDTNNRAVNNSSTDVVVVLSNGTVSEDFANAVASDSASGDALFSMPTVVSSDDGTTVPIRVYNDEAPDSVEDTETYGVYKSVGGEDAIVVNLGDSFEDADQVSVRSVGNAGFIDAIQHRVATNNVFEGVRNSLPMGALSVGDLIVATPLLFAAARRRRIGG